MQRCVIEGPVHAKKFDHHAQVIYCIIYCKRGKGENEMALRRSHSKLRTKGYGCIYYGRKYSHAVISTQQQFERDPPLRPYYSVFTKLSCAAGWKFVRTLEHTN